MWWDWKTYRWNKDTRIDEMGLPEVSRRMTTFRQWTKYEVMGISIWIILFNIPQLLGDGISSGTSQRTSPTDYPFRSI